MVIMTDKKEQDKWLTELSRTFLLLDEPNQEYALGILRALMFAQNNHQRIGKPPAAGPAFKNQQ